MLALLAGKPLFAQDLDIGEPAADPVADSQGLAADVDESAESDTAAATVSEPDVAADMQPLQHDVVLVLDNSGSMRQNDPDMLALVAVRQFIDELSADSRIAIIIFDESVRLVQPFVEIGGNAEQIKASLDTVDYRGRYTDSPAAIERAVYELKNNSRVDARRFIVFMTDGIVDIGDNTVESQRSEWLRTDLTIEAKAAEVQIFGIAFTNEADFQLIQSLASRTDGDYFRAFSADDLAGVFSRMNDAVKRAALPEPEPTPPPAPPPAPPPEPVIIEVPVQTPGSGSGDEERLRSLIMIASAIVLIIVLLAILLVLIRRSRQSQPYEESEHEARAFLNDLHGLTSQATYDLGRKPTMIGRVGGSDTEHLNYVVIPETTIGRRHALIEYKDYAFWIMDQGSINGTFVNDKMVTTETRLKHGDRIRLHKWELEFVMPDMADSSMTVVSQTVYAEQHAGDPDRLIDDDDGFNVDSQPSDGIQLSEDDFIDDDDEATIQRLPPDIPAAQPAPAAPQADSSDDDEDATIAPEFLPDGDAEDATLQHFKEAAGKSGHAEDDDDDDDTSPDKR
ncbi:MAG: VWA domain-containing protein [Gammaproteobacteria bacterium]